MIIGATPEGKKELVGLTDGVREREVVLLPQSPSKVSPGRAGGFRFGAAQSGLSVLPRPALFSHSAECLTSVC